MTDPKDDLRFDPEVIRRSFMSSDIPPASEVGLDGEAATLDPCVACEQCKICGGRGLTTKPRNAWFRWAIGLVPGK